MEPSEARENEHAEEGGRLYGERNYGAALSSFEQALEIARQRGDVSGQIVYLANCGAASANLQNFPRAESFFKEALILADRIGHRHVLLQLRRSLAIACFQQRHPEEARAQLEAALEIVRSGGDRTAEPELLGYMGVVHSMSGRYDEAHAALQC